MKLIVTDLENFNLPVSGEHKIIKPDSRLCRCVGCFNCWFKTPGKCVIADGFDDIGALWGKCDEVYYVCRCVYGSLSPFAKNIQDRGLAYVHPDFVIRGGEMHHRRRYDNVIKCSVLFYGETTEGERQTARKLMQAAMDNYDGTVERIEFFDSVEDMEGISL